MFCEKCGKELKDEWGSCPYCGAKTDITVEAENKGEKNKVKKVVSCIGAIIVFVLLCKSCTGEGERARGNNDGTGRDIDVKSLKMLTQEEVEGFLLNDSEDSPIRITTMQTTPKDMFDFMEIHWKIANQTGVDIKKATFGIAAWDKNGLPLTLSTWDSIDENPVMEVDFENIASGYSSDQDGQYCSKEIDYEEIGYMNIVVLSYEDYEGNQWENPAKVLYEDMASKPIDESTIAYEMEQVVQ